MKRYILIMLTFLYVSSFAQIPEMVEGWPYLTRTEYSMPRFSLDTNPDSSAIFFNNITNDIDKFHLDGTFFQGWPIIQERTLFGTTPVIVDIDHDSKDEIVLRGAVRTEDNHYSHSVLYIIDDDGSIFPGFPQLFNHLRPPNVADLDSDGEYEIIFFSPCENEIYCIDRFGNSKPGWPITMPDDVIGSASGAGAVGDLDLDGCLEYIVKGNYNIYAYRHDGAMQEGFPIPVLDAGFFYIPRYGPYLGDVDLDGYLEILVSADSLDNGDFSCYVAVYEHNGQLKENWPLRFPGEFSWMMPIPADINDDGVPEMGFAAGPFTYFVDVDGNNLPGWPVMFTRPDGQPREPTSDIIAVDIDGDGDCEIFCDYNGTHADSVSPDSTEWYWGHSYLFACDHLGQNLPGYPIEVNGEYFSRPPAFAYDEVSHQLYMGLFTELDLPSLNIDTAYVEIYLFPDSTGPPDQWPMMSHDNLHTKNYNFVDNVTAIHEGKEPLPKTYVLMQNYPNPFNSSTVIQFSLPKEEEIELAVYDILGRKVAELAHGRFSAGSHRVKWNSADCASGMYFYTMQTAKTQISRKMMLLR